MREIDTSAEAVERLAAIMDSKAAGTSNSLGDAWGDFWCGNAAATLRAIAAERDEWLNRLHEAQVDSLQAYDAMEAAEADRDRLAAENARLREALQRWQHYGCPDCEGDCGSANPPVVGCIMQETRAALAPEPGHD